MKLALNSPEQSARKAGDRLFGVGLALAGKSRRSA